MTDPIHLGTFDTLEQAMLAAETDNAMRDLFATLAPQPPHPLDPLLNEIQRRAYTPAEKDGILARSQRTCNWCGEEFIPQLAGITLCDTCMGSE